MMIDKGRSDGSVHTADDLVDTICGAGHTRAIMNSRVTYLFAGFADTERVGAAGS